MPGASWRAAYRAMFPQAGLEAGKPHARKRQRSRIPCFGTATIVPRRTRTLRS